ncbi:hypothetical protein [Streptomyces virginiae]|nr:hypothetical protein OG253_39015 [Streptomyces virginiae]
MSGTKFPDPSRNSCSASSKAPALPSFLGRYRPGPRIRYYPSPTP